MSRNIDNTIVFVRKYILKKYNHFVLNVDKRFIGCKFHNDRYYIFFISAIDGKITLTYRWDFTERDVIRIPIWNLNNAKLANLLKNIMKSAIEKNETLPDKRKLLSHSLVNYNYMSKKNNIIDISVNSNNVIIDSEDNKGNINTDCVDIETNYEENDCSILNNYLNVPLKNVNMSRRLKNALLRAGIESLGDFIKLDSYQIGRIRNLGEVSIKEAKVLLNQLSKNPLKYIVFDKTSNTEEKSESFEVTISDNLIDKLYSDITIDECDFSVRLKNCLKQNNVFTFADFIRCSADELAHMDNLGKKTYNEAIECKKKLAQEFIWDDDNSDFIIRIIKVLSNDEEVSVISLKNYLINNTEYPVDKLVNDINILRTNGKIEYTMNGIRVKRKKLLDVLNEFDLPTKMLLMERLNGKTLQEIGDSLCITKERVRQKMVKAFEKIPLVEEDRYKDLFEQYGFTKEEFTKVFNVDEYVYNYLKEKYRNGIFDIEMALKDDRLNENQKKAIRGLKKIVRLFGETIVINRQNVVNALVKQYAQNPITIEIFKDYYNNFVNDNPEYNMDIADNRSIEGILYRSNFAIFGLGRQFRYYDFYNILPQDYESLKLIFLNIDAGYYSTLYIYRNNLELMASINIRDEYELHNLCKKFFNNKYGIVFDRMPNFSVNGVTKDEFLKEKIEELSPISLSDFAEIMESDYGHKSSTLMSYITAYMPAYISNGILKGSISTLSDTDIDKIKDIVNEPIYNIDDLKALLVHNGFRKIDEIISFANMYKVGYKIRSNYVYRREIGSVEEYYKKLANETDFIANYNSLKNSSYFQTIKKIEKDLDIFLINNDEYITIKKLNLLGITKEDVIRFINEIKDEFKYTDYFTLSNVRDLIVIEKLDDFGFDDIFFENIMINIDGISYARFSGNKIFSFVYQSFDSKKFVIDCIGNRSSVFIDELQNEFLNTYGMEVLTERIKGVIASTDLYYSDDLGKIYQTKEYYYKEVYNNE